MSDTETNPREAALSPSIEEAQAWANLADAISAMWEFVPTNHFVEDHEGSVSGVTASSQYADVYPVLVQAERECNQLAGLKMRLGGGFDV